MLPRQFHEYPARPVGIIGTGSCLPDRVVSNDEAGAPAGVDDAWIVGKTGIHTRRWAGPGEATSDLCLVAAEGALKEAGITASDLSLIIVATSTPDSPQPPTAALLAAQLGAPPTAAAFDLNAVCSGFVFGLDIARHYVAGSATHVLVIGADIYSRVINRADRRTAVLLGDGAGAVVLGPSPAGEIVASRILTYGDYRELVAVPAGGSRLPTTTETVLGEQHYFMMQGRAVTEFVLGHVPDAVAGFLTDAGVAADEIDHVISHQANAKLIATLAGQLGLPRAVPHQTVERYGNTGAASVPVTLDDAVRANRIEPGELVLLVGFGGGMSIGLTLLRW